jgi:hypothetical protein
LKVVSLAPLAFIVWMEPAATMHTHSDLQDNPWQRSRRWQRPRAFDPAFDILLPISKLGSAGPNQQLFQLRDGAVSPLLLVSAAVQVAQSPHFDASHLLIRGAPCPCNKRMRQSCGCMAQWNVQHVCAEYVELPDKLVIRTKFWESHDIVLN